MVLLGSGLREMTSGARNVTSRVLALAFILLSTATSSCAGSSEQTEPPLPLVVVPNEVLGDLVERVACVEEVDVGIGPDDSGRDPLVVLALAEPEAPRSDGALVISVPALTTTIDQPGGADPWVWLDPIRFGELSRGVGAALAQSGQFDPALLDRCIARIEAEMARLDRDLFEITQQIPADDRSIDVSLPGTLYFANRYEFLISESDTAIQAGRIMSVDELGGAATYDDMMRSNIERVVDTLSSG